MTSPFGARLSKNWVSSSIRVVPLRPLTYLTWGRMSALDQESGRGVLQFDMRSTQNGYRPEQPDLALRRSPFHLPTVCARIERIGTVSAGAEMRPGRLA